MDRHTPWYGSRHIFGPLYSSAKNQKPPNSEKNFVVTLGQDKVFT
jgi:hypothetical protein